MSNLRKVTVLMTNQTTSQKPATMEITNASTTQGTLVTKSFPIPVGTNGDQQSVQAEATSPRQGAIGQVNYVVQNIPNCSVNFNNTMSESSVDFVINGGWENKIHINNNGHDTVVSEGFIWNFDTQVTDTDYVINVKVSSN